MSALDKHASNYMFKFFVYCPGESQNSASSFLNSTLRLIALLTSIGSDYARTEWRRIVIKPVDVFPYKWFNWHYKILSKCVSSFKLYPSDWLEIIMRMNSLLKPFLLTGIGYIVATTGFRNKAYQKILSEYLSGQKCLHYIY